MSDVTPKTETPCIETDWWRDEARGGYTYEDRDNDQPTLRFVDDIEGFWRPFSEKVAALIASERGT